MPTKWTLERLRRLRADDGGAAALEFAIVAWAFVVVTMGVIELGRSLQVRNEMAYAMDWGARTVLMDADASEEKIAEAIRARFYSYDNDEKKLIISAPEETVPCTNDGTPGTMVTRAVSVSYKLEVFIPGLTKTFDIKLARLVPKGECV